MPLKKGSDLVDKKDKKFFSKVIYFALGAALLISIWIVIKPRAVDVEIAIVQRGPFKEHFTIEGKTRSRKKITLFAYANGDLEKIQLKVGDSVKKGQLLTRLQWDGVKDVISPYDGVILQVFREAGGPINRGEPIVEIADPGDLELVAEPLTPDATHISVGAEADVTGLEGAQTYHAKVSKISRAGFVKTSALGVEEERTEVILSLLDVPIEIIRRVGDNFHVEVSILLFAAEDVLQVPLGALFRDQENWAVFKVVNKKAKKQLVVIAGRNEKEAILKSGLNEGDEIILFPSDIIKEDTLVE
jgi:HlyD family secretion protein